jgi:hypothetical protein
LASRPPRWPALIALACVACACAGALASPAEHPDLPLPFRALVHWDSNWYEIIAREGYWYRPGEQSPVAFFPAFPLLVATLALCGLNRFMGEVVIAFICGQEALKWFWRWASLQSSEPVATDALWTMAVFPLAFFLYGVGYSDALFLLLAVGAFVALERDRPVLAALLGAGAALCRPVAPAIAVGLLVRSIERRRRARLPVRAVDLVPALSGLGLVAFMAYLQWKVGDALAFAHVQSAPGWDQQPGWRTWVKIALVDAFRSGRLTWPEQARLICHALVAGTGLLLLWPTFKRLGVGYGVYATVALIIPVIGSKDFIGIGRYAFAAFPLFLTAALILRERKVLLRGWQVVSAALLVVLAFQFGAGAYLS